jgi:hypothetical protein
VGGVQPDSERKLGRAAIWAIRITIWSAFLLTVWFFGPRAADVLAMRLRHSENLSPAVDLGKVGFAARPDWMSTEALVVVSRDLQPWLHDTIPILDERSARRLQEGLRQVPWVRDLRLQRVFPDRFRMQVGLRRPVLLVKSGDGSITCSVDRDGIALPVLPGLNLPATVLRSEGGAEQLSFRHGEVVADERVLAAAAVAVEWRDEIAPLVPQCPDLVEVDANNLGERWISHPRYPELRVFLRRADGEAVRFGYDRGPDARRARVPSADKAYVLRAVLAKYPGLAGLTAGDLRFLVRWESWLQPRKGRDPAEPWASR